MYGDDEIRLNYQKRVFLESAMASMSSSSYQKDAKEVVQVIKSLQTPAAIEGIMFVFLQK